MHGAIDLLASEYGWSKNEILNSVYPDEFIHLSESIHKRQVDEMIAQLRIVSNPHLDADKAKELAEELMDTRRRLHGFVDMNATLDKEGLLELKAELAKKSRTISVK